MYPRGTCFFLRSTRKFHSNFGRKSRLSSHSPQLPSRRWRGNGNLLSTGYVLVRVSARTVENNRPFTTNTHHYEGRPHFISPLSYQDRRQDAAARRGMWNGISWISVPCRIWILNFTLMFRWVRNLLWLYTGTWIQQNLSFTYCSEITIPCVENTYILYWSDISLVFSTEINGKPQYAN